MEVRKIVVSCAALSALLPLSTLAVNDGPIGPRCNPADQYRFFWYMNGTFYREVVDAGFNMLINAHGANYSRYSAEQRAKANMGRREFVEMMDRDGIDHVEQVKIAHCNAIKKDYAQKFKDGSPNPRSMDFNIPACKAEVRDICAFTAAALTNLPAMVGVQTSSE